MCAKLCIISIKTEFDLPFPMQGWSSEIAFSCLYCQLSGCIHFAFEFVAVCRLRQGETPSFFLYQDWAIGLLALKMGFRFLLGWPQLNPHGPQPQPQLQPDTDDAGPTNGLLQPVTTLQAHLRRLKAQGLTRISFADAFRSVLWPLILFWGVAVSVPYVLTRGLGPRLPFASEQALQTIFMFGWLCEGAVLLGCVSCVHVLTALERLGSKLRDQRYLLHRELINVSD